MRAARSLCFVELYSLFILIYYIYYLAFGSSLLRDCRVEAWAFYQEISCSLNLSQPHPWILKQIFTYNLLYFWVLTTNCKYFLVASNIEMWSRIIIIFLEEMKIYPFWFGGAYYIMFVLLFLIGMIAFLVDSHATCLISSGIFFQVLVDAWVLIFWPPITAFFDTLELKG